MLENNRYIGLPGQIIEVGEADMLVLCKDGLLKITEFENIDHVKLFAGHKLK